MIGVVVFLIGVGLPALVLLLAYPYTDRLFRLASKLDRYVEEHRDDPDWHEGFWPVRVWRIVRKLWRETE